MGVGRLRIVTRFRKPTEVELEHDFLLRATSPPGRGDVASSTARTTRTCWWSGCAGWAPTEEVEARYGLINDFEHLLTENGTTVLKFMLHISKKEQAVRLQDRLDEPNSRWELNPADLEDRKLWDKYQAAYETTPQRCSAAHAPWYVIPADRKWARNAAVAAIVREDAGGDGPAIPTGTEGLQAGGSPEPCNKSVQATFMLDLSAIHPA